MKLRKLPPALTEEEGFLSAVTQVYDVPATPSPNGGHYGGRPMCSLYGHELQAFQQMPPGVFAGQPLAVFAPQVAHYTHGPVQVPPPPAMPPYFSSEGFMEPPPAPVHLPSVDFSAPRGGQYSAMSTLGDDLAQQVAQQTSTVLDYLTQEVEVDPARALNIKNTFIDSGLQRSPSLECFLRQGWQAQSCPGSRMPSPNVYGIGTMSGLREFEAVMDADTSYTACPMSMDKAYQHHKLDGMTSSKPSLQAAAWQRQSRPFEERAYYQAGSECSGQLQQKHATDMASASFYQAALPKVLQLEHALVFGSNDEPPEALLPRLGSPDLPSVGSLGHHVRRCKPCAFVTRMGCSNGLQCRFCHLCETGEKKRRRKEKRALIGAARKLSAA